MVPLAWLAVLLTVTAADVRVVDGDTIAAHGENWRLSGYDTPETLFARCARERILGHAATLRLRALIDGAGHIEIVARSGRDRYRRRLGVLLLDGADVADTMIEEGLARRYRGGRRQGWCGER